MLIPSMAVNPLGCPTIPHNDEQNIFANSIRKNVLLDVHIHVLSPHNSNHVKHL